MDEKAVIELIIATSTKLTQDKERLIALFKNTGIIVNDDLSVNSISGSPEETLKKLMVNLNQMPVIKITAKQIIRKSGI